MTASPRVLHNRRGDPPERMEGPLTKDINVTVAPDIRRKIEREARTRGVTISRVVRDRLREM